MYQVSIDKSLETPSLQEPNKLKVIKNYCELQDSNAVITIKTKGNKFILSKLYPYYYIKHNSLLLEYISEHEIKSFLDDLNRIIANNWPPKKLILLSYLLIPLSCGFSLLCPYYCFNNAERFVAWKIEEYNIKWEDKGLKLKWQDEMIQIHLYNKRGKPDYDDYHDIDVIIS
ncbi:unnamed protein product [Paramecium octaurelia]|uniref:Uncharacterized protein n=1 Tax=Paramecium octaurelia TaxID=43137 RepID=A0A8S1SRW0_PAROT|nr:unnamed protein product [Paramecium octaurelia]